MANRSTYDVLHNFISPVTGRLLCPEDYIFVGNREGIAEPSPALIDVRLDITKIRRDVADISASSFVLKAKSNKLPNAQALDQLNNGFMYNTGGVISTTNNIPLPSLPYKNLWIGNILNKAESSPVIYKDNLPNLTSNKIWIGDINNRPVEKDYNAAPDNATYILQRPSAGLANAQGLNALGGGILKTTPLSNGVISIASGGKIPVINDYVRPIDLQEEILETKAFATAEAAAAEAAAIAASTLYFNEQMLPFSAVPLVPAGAAITTAIAAAVLPKEDKSSHDADINAVNDKIDNLNLNLVGEVKASGKLKDPIEAKVGFSFFKKSELPVNPHLGMLLFVEV